MRRIDHELRPDGLRAAHYRGRGRQQRQVRRKDGVLEIERDLGEGPRRGVHHLEQLGAGLLFGGVDVLVAVDNIQIDGKAILARRQRVVAARDLLVALRRFVPHGGRVLHQEGEAMVFEERRELRGISADGVAHGRIQAVLDMGEHDIQIAARAADRVDFGEPLLLHVARQLGAIVQKCALGWRIFAGLEQFDGVEAAGGFDPIELFQTRKDAPSQRAFLDYRAKLARDMQQQWLAEIESIRRTRSYLDVVLTHVDDRLDTSRRDAIGADSAQLLPLLEHHNFTFLVEDPATVWNEAPQRYEEIARRYHPLTPRQDRLAIDLNIVDRNQNVYPTKQQTGAELFEVVHSAAGAFAQVALYFENSILSPDLSLLPASAAVVSRAETVGPKLMVDSPHGVALRWSGPAMVDGLPWPVQSGSLPFLPPGAHSVETPPASPALQVTRFNGELTSAQSVDAHSIELSYRSSARAFAILNRKPVRVEIDGAETAPDPAGPNVIFLPRGQHLVTIHSE